jgi:hypothetical protein
MIEFDREVNSSLDLGVFVNNLNRHPVIFSLKILQILSSDGNFSQDMIPRSVFLVKQIKGKVMESSRDLKVNLFSEERTENSDVVIQDDVCKHA